MKQRPEPLIVDAVVRGGRIAMVNQQDYLARAKKAAAKWGAGTALKVRIEPEQDARRRSQDKFFYGYICEPLEQFTGDLDWPLRLKLMFAPEGKRSLTELSYEEMATLIQKSEAWARSMCPEAFDLYGREYVG